MDEDSLQLILNKRLFLFFLLLLLIPQFLLVFTPIHQMQTLKMSRMSGKSDLRYVALRQLYKKHSSISLDFIKVSWDVTVLDIS